MKKDNDNSDKGRILDPPLAYEKTFELFNKGPKGKIPKDLQSMFLPEPEPYKLQEIKADKLKQLQVEATTPNIPDWFGISPIPQRALLPPAPRIGFKGREANPLTMFAPEDRRTYNDISYPWGTICRVVTAAGQGSGVIVGPRHVVTASHVVDWSGNGGGTVEVHRAGGSVRASTAITKIWYYTKVTGSIGWFEQDEDYAVLITSQRIGDLFGWMGTRTYSSSWDNEPYWWNIGYPGSIGSGIQPTFQRNCRLNEPWYDFGPARSMSTRADLTPGNSGGPMFGFWSNGPYVVAVASSETSSENWCAGGSWLTNLVSHAISHDP